MSIEKMTEDILQTPSQDSLPWLESNTWDKSSMWQTDFQAESLWEDNGIENKNIQSSTIAKQPLFSSKSQRIEQSEIQSFEDDQLVEVVEGEILLTDSLNEHPLDKSHIKKGLLKVNEPIAMQEPHKEVEVEPTDTYTFFDDFPLDDYSDLEQPLHTESLRASEEQLLPLSTSNNDFDSELSSVNENTNKLNASQLKEIEVRSSVEQLTSLNTNNNDLNPDLLSSVNENEDYLDTPRVKEVEIQPSVEQPIHLKVNNDDLNLNPNLSLVSGNKNDNASQVRESEVQLPFEQPIPLDTSKGDFSPNLSSANENKNDGAITIDIPIHLVPIVRELITLFEQHPPNKVQSLAFKNTFKNKETVLQKIL